jgi:hypothetical protein
VKFSVRYVHKISPTVQDIGLDIELSFKARLSSRNLAQELREKKVLEPETRVRSFRQEGRSLVVFPDRGIWHSVILTPKDIVWFVVLNQYDTILAVLDGSSLAAAQAKAKEIEEKTSSETRLEKVCRSFRPEVGKNFKNYY